MKDQINKENYEIVFFQLMEGEYSDNEKTALLDTIAQDSFLAFEWENWKKAKLPNNDIALYNENFTEFFEGIKNEAIIYNTPEEQKESKNKILPIFFAVSSVAACILAVLFFFNDQTDSRTEMVKEVVLPLDNSITSVDQEATANEIDTIILASTVKSSKLTSIEPTPPAPTNDSVQTEDIVTEDNILKEQNTIEESLDIIMAGADTAFSRLANADEIKSLLQSIDTAYQDKNAIASVQQPKRQLKFTVEKHKIPPQIILTSLAQLSDMNIDVTALMEDQKVFVLRNSDGLFLRLEKDGGEILIALR
ncbi:MAG: hypothetical protein COA58_09055 [Bacteroidetes bacterium]|nr:MAG: hypothetical protein COA58_09055 [Bacteroidota bacterium]